jgi:integrase
MAPRKRQKDNADLPPHVAVNVVKGTKYYRYTMPDGTRYNLGKNKVDAVNAALTLNAELNRNPDILQRIYARQIKLAEQSNPIPTLGFAIDQFESRIEQKKYAQTTLANIHQQLARYRAEWGHIRVNAIEHLKITGFLNHLSPHAYVKHKNLLVDLWGYCVHQGWCQENIPAKTMQAILPDKQRTRHTLDAVMQIRAISPDYLQRAIDLALHSLQRRADLVKLQRTSVNVIKNTVTVLQQKTLKYATPVHIEIDMHPELAAAVQACLSTSLAFQCPYLLHYRPKRMTDQVIDGKLHKFAITEGFLSKQFAKYRDAAKVYDDLAIGQRPSFHDLRALGIVLITERYGKDYAMALAGHADERMWKHYTKGHAGYDQNDPVRISYRS